MKKIPLTQGKFALVDDADYISLSKHKWHYSAGYAMRRQKKIIMMHREIMSTPDNLEVDHKNRDGLDNRRSNLRNCTRSQNSLNKKAQSNNTSGYKGVFWRADKKLWRCRVGKKHIGSFKNKIHAAMAYDIAAKELFGDFAKLNFSN